MLTYTLSLRAPQTHRYVVTLEVPGWTEPRATLHLPAWTPGSYLIREFARHVERFAATTLDGAALPWRRAAKGKWEVEGTSGGFRLRYEVYAYELTVRTSHLDSSHGYFNGSNLFLYLEGAEKAPLTLRIEAPPGWHCSIALDEEAPFRYRAPDYDTLADSPGEVGTHRRLFFEALGVPHEVALWGQGNEDEEELVADLKRIVEGIAAFFGGPLPYERYLFIFHLGDRLGGGLEHRDSTTLAVDRWSFAPRSAYEKVLRLAIHEFFHVWHVKRIRPHNLGPFDYGQEAYTPLLWVMEGFTTYYDLLFMARLGFISGKRALDMVAERIEQYEKQPGRTVQPLEESSLLAWIKLYRPDENSLNSSISYYLKGSLAALTLDLRLRAASEGRRSLDDVVRALWERYGKDDVGFTPEQFEALLDEVAGEPMGDFLDRHVRGLEELPYYRALRGVGIEPINEQLDTPWLGLLTKSEVGALIVRAVLRDGPAEAAGIAPNDRLLALDGVELRDERFLNARLGEYQPEDHVTLHFFRMGLLQSAEVTLGSAPPENLMLLPPSQDEPRRALFEDWLKVTG